MENWKRVLLSPNDCLVDAVAILENLGIEVEVKGNGKVKRQSISKGTDLKSVKKIVLELI